MRQVTREIVRAFRNGERKSIGNSSTDGKSLYLHGNKIAENIDGSVYISSAGWQSNTTKERLNGIPGVSVFQKNWQWYLNGELWDGSWIKI